MKENEIKSGQERDVATLIILEDSKGNVKEEKEKKKTPGKRWKLN